MLRTGRGAARKQGRGARTVGAGAADNPAGPAFLDAGGAGDAGDARGAGRSVSAAPASSALGPPMTLAVPPGYRLERLLRVSESAALPPLLCDADRALLQLVVYAQTHGPHLHGQSGAEPAPAAIEVLVWQPGPGASLRVRGVPAEAAAAATAQLRRVLGLDEDLSLFHHLTDQDADLAWAAGEDAGRILCAPTVFEDLVKVALLTRAGRARAPELLGRILAAGGARTDRGRPAFPAAPALAQALAAVARTDARAASVLAPLRALAERVASGWLYPEALRRAVPSPLPALAQREDATEKDWSDAIDSELEWSFRVRALLERLPGIGPRAVERMLPLLGCYDGLCVDAEARAAWRRRFPPATRTQARTRARAAGTTASAPGAARDTRARSTQTQARHAEIERIVRRVDRFDLYRGLAQAVLLRGPL